MDMLAEHEWGQRMTDQYEYSDEKRTIENKIQAATTRLDGSDVSS